MYFLFGSVVLIALFCDLGSFYLGVRRLNSDGPSGVPFFGCVLVAVCGFSLAAMGFFEWEFSRNFVGGYFLLQLTLQIGVLYIIYQFVGRGDVDNTPQ